MSQILNRPWKSLKKVNVIPLSIQKERISSEHADFNTPKSNLNFDSDSNIEIEVIENPIRQDTRFNKEIEFFSPKSLNKRLHLKKNEMLCGDAPDQTYYSNVQ